jgi:hypothetical protein
MAEVELVFQIKCANTPKSYMKNYVGVLKLDTFYHMGLVASNGTDPGTLAAATNDMIAIMANRPLFNSDDLFLLSVASSTFEKSIGGKIIVGSSPPLV